MVTLTQRPEIEERVGAARNIALFLDYDGTLTPLTADPSGAALDDAVRETLAALSRKDGVFLAIVSGRAASHLRELIGLPNCIYAGNHGLEIEGPGFSFVEPAAAAARDELGAIAGSLESALAAVPGAFVERKGLTASVHYRNVAAAELERVERAVRETVAPAAARFRLGSGKMLWEILPRTDWNKGSAVRWILRRLGKQHVLSIYFGDDRTDEDAFRALPEGLTFKVGGQGGTEARFRVADPAAVEEFLVWLKKKR